MKCLGGISENLFLSTPSARRATKAARLTSRATRISIHALREEGDGDGRAQRPTGCNFYPRPPRGGRPRGKQEQNGKLLFLSTPSARRATRAGHITAHFGNISIHALREEGDSTGAGASKWGKLFLSTPSARRATRRIAAVRRGGNISIHALREEGDCGTAYYPSRPCYFYPRPPRGGRPLDHACPRLQIVISIHALREEGDQCAEDPCTA